MLTKLNETTFERDPEYGYIERDRRVGGNGQTGVGGEEREDR